MTAIQANLSTAAALRSAAAARPSKPAPARSEEPSAGSGVDEFRKASPDRNKSAFEGAYNAVGVLEAMTRVVARSGQLFTLAGGLAGVPVPGLAGLTAVVGGTYDVAQGSSQAMGAAINRDTKGEWLGNLQLVQGMATYGTVMASAFGAPPAVGMVTAGVATAALAGRLGIKAADSLRERFGSKEEPAPPAAPVGPRPGERYEGPDDSKGGRKHEKAFAFARANGEFFKGLGGVGAFWANVDGIRGNPPSDGLWGLLGVVGGSYSFLNGVSTATNAAIHRNKDGTITGTLQSVQGLATLATTFGMGRPAAVVAVGAWAAKTAYTIYSQVKAVRGGEEDEKGEAPEPKAVPPASDWVATKVADFIASQRQPSSQAA